MTMLWTKRDLVLGADIGLPSDLPTNLQGLAEISLADLSWSNVAEFDGVGFFPVEIVEVAEPALPVLQVTMYQAQMALLHVGKLDQVEAAITAIADPLARRAAEIAWRTSNVVRRNSPLLAALAPGLNLDEAALDALFKGAALITLDSRYLVQH